LLNGATRASDTQDMARVLVIDDEESICHLVRLVLESVGHEVLIADDGSRGFASAHRKRPDLIILDLMMPVMDGFAVLEALREDKRTRSIPVLILSAIQAAAVEQRCLRLGAKGYVRKPFLNDTIIETIRGMIDSRS
jgi:CheY-like chemotaxis protein